MSVETQAIVVTDSHRSASKPEDIINRWIERLEEQIRKFPEESILISFLVGGLLQIGFIRSLLLNCFRLVLLLATPVLFGFAAWRLYHHSLPDRVEH